MESVYISTKAAGEKAGVDPRTVREWYRKGKVAGRETVDANGQKRIEVDLLSLMRKTDPGGFSEDGDKSTEEWQHERIKADALMKIAKAAMLDLELKEMRGEYHRGEHVEELVSDFMLAVRAAVLALPGKLGPQLADVDDAARAAALVKAECCALLEDLSAHAYDPAAYRERLAAERGKEARDDDG